MWHRIRVEKGAIMNDKTINRDSDEEMVQTKKKVVKIFISKIYNKKKE